jgi:putative SOS response-associated peptidase YedK
MCGRISTANLLPEDISGSFHTNTVPSFLHSYNVAPTLKIPAIREQKGTRSLNNLRWGFIPHWARDKRIKASTFNARIETLAQKPFYRDSIKSKRCIIPASGFYEWQKQGGKKQAYYIFNTDQKPLALAGLWDVWVDEVTQETLESCTIITVPAIYQMAEIHERMPAILEAESFGTWLDPEFMDTHFIVELLRARKDVLSMYPVSSYVNNSRHDGEKCIEESRRES